MERGETAFLASPTQSCGSCCFGKGGGGILASNNRGEGGELLGASSSSAFPLLLTSSFAAAAKGRGIEGRAEMVRSPSPSPSPPSPGKKRTFPSLLFSSSPFSSKKEGKGGFSSFSSPFSPSLLRRKHSSLLFSSPVLLFRPPPPLSSLRHDLKHECYSMEERQQTISLSRARQGKPLYCRQK